MTKLPVNNSNIPAVKTPVMVLYEKVGNGNVQFSPAVAVSGGFRITVGRQHSQLNEYNLKIVGNLNINRRILSLADEFSNSPNKRPLEPQHCFYWLRA